MDLIKAVLYHLINLREPDPEDLGQNIFCHSGLLPSPGGKKRDSGGHNNQIPQRTHIMESMKIKIKITGPNVHDVGYRYLLMSNAIDLGLKGFHARNRTNGKDQEVIALLEGDEEAIADFKEMVESKKPEKAKVSNIAFEDYDSDVMRVGEYAQISSAEQLGKAIPILLKIQDNTALTPQILDEIKAVRKNTDAIPQVLEDLPGYATNFRQMQADIRSIKERLGMS